MVRMTETQITFREHDEDHDTIVEKLKTNGWVVQMETSSETLLSHPQMAGNFRQISKN